MTTKAPARLPQQFGRYQIIKLLGEGGMGAVYLARDNDLGRDVALKTPTFEGIDEAESLERFRQEARAAAKVHHPNICPIFDVGEIDGIRYLTMAFIEGKPLAEWVASGKPMSQKQIANLVRKVALALQEAHRNGVIHRDLKPSNIMMDRRGEPIVMDFGLARRRQESGDRQITQAGRTMGSPAYMPPEQVKGDVLAMGPASDIFSLGVVLFELLTGRPPFIGDNFAILAQIMTEEPPEPSSLRPGGVEPGLEAICLKAMSKRVEDRHHSMAEFATELADYMRGITQAVNVAESTDPPATPPSDVQVVVVPPAQPKSAFGSKMGATFIGGQRSLVQMYQGMGAGQGFGASSPTSKSLASPGPQSSLRRRRKRVRKESPVLWIVGGVGAVVLVLGIVVGVMISRGSHHDKELSVNESTSKQVAERPIKPNVSNRPADKTGPDPDPAPVPAPNIPEASKNPSNPEVGKKSDPSSPPQGQAPDKQPDSSPQGKVPANQPESLRAPFTAAEAQAAQQAWAEYLGKKVEEKIDIGRGLKMVFVLIPPGSFKMGSPGVGPDQGEPGETPQHDVTITKPFYLGKYLVTQAEYVQLTGKKNPSAFSARGKNNAMVAGMNTNRFPVEQVTWSDADDCGSALEKKLGGGWSKVRLPSEAMWEYACRAGTETLWYVGKNLTPNDANFGQRYGRTRPVGEGTANAFGLFDMHGHVWEWVSDYLSNYSSESQTDPEGPDSGSERLNRAGGWNSPAWLCRSAIRTGRDLSYSNQNVGFRLALVPSAKAK